MRILISVAKMQSLSAKPYVKGDRVAVKGDDKLWFIGTVTTVGQKVRITFDDGDKLTIEHDSTGVKRLPENTPVKKRGQTLQQLKDIADKAKSKVQPKTKAKVETKVKPKTEVEPKTKAKVETKVKPKTEKVIETQSLMPSDGPSLIKFDRIANDKDKFLSYMKQWWLYYNKKYFHSELKLPLFRIQKAIKATSFRLLGSWSPSRSIMSFSMRLSNTEDAAHRTLLHEMCHQAVTQIDKLTVRGSTAAHGSPWQSWMRKCGLDPLSRKNRDDYLSEDEKEQKQVLQEKYKAVREEHKEISYPQTGMRVAFLNPKTQKVVQGVLACPLSGGNWAVTVDPSKPRLYGKINSHNLFEAPQPELLGEGYDQAAAALRTLFQENKDIRKSKANRRKALHNLLGGYLR